MSNFSANVVEIGIIGDGAQDVFLKSINTLTFYPVFNAGGYGDAQNLSALRYTWSFGDGSSASGNTSNKIYKKAGTFVTSLYIYENGGLVKTITREIVIRNVVSDNLTIRNIPISGVFQTNQSVPLTLTIDYTIDTTTSNVEGTIPVVELYSRGSFSEPRVSVEKWSHLIPQWYFTNTNDVLTSRVELTGVPLYSDLSGNTSTTQSSQFKYPAGEAGYFSVKYTDDLPTYDYNRVINTPVTVFFSLNSTNKKKDSDSTIFPSYSNTGVLFPESFNYQIARISTTRKFETILPQTLMAGAIIKVSGNSSRTITKAYLKNSLGVLTSEEFFFSTLGLNGEFEFNVKSLGNSSKIIFEYDGTYDISTVDITFGFIDLVSIPSGVRVFAPVTVKRLEPNTLSITKDGKTIDVSPIQWIGVKSRFFATMTDSTGVVLKNYPMDILDVESKTVNFSLLTGDTLAQGVFEYNSGVFLYGDENGRKSGGFIKNWFKPYFQGTNHTIKVNGVLKYHKNEITSADTFDFKNSLGDFSSKNGGVVKRSLSGLYCMAPSTNDGVYLEHPFVVGRNYNFDFEFYSLSGSNIRLSGDFGTITPTIQDGVTSIVYTPTLSSGGVYLSTVSGAGEFIIKNFRIHEDVAEKLFEGYSTDFGVYDLYEQKNIRKVNQTVDMAGLLKSYALQEQLSNSNVLWGTFASTVFGTLSSDVNSMGNTFFEKIGNFFENHVSIDTSEMRSIASVNSLLGEVTDKYASDIPLTLNKLMNVVSINDKDLVGSADKYKRNYVENYADPSDLTSNIITSYSKSASILNDDFVVMAGSKYVFNTKHTTDYETIEIPKAQASWKNFADVDPYIQAVPLSAFPLIEYPLSAVRHGLLDYPVFAYYDIFKFRDVATGEIVGNILDFSLPSPLSGYSREEIVSGSWSAVGGIQDILFDNAISSIVLTYDVSDYTPIVYPSVTLTTGYPEILNTSFTVTATFSEQMSGFEVLDISTTNATLSGFSEASPNIYTFTVIPNYDGLVNVTIPTGVSQNYEGRGNLVSNVLTFTYDTTPPEVTITSSPSELPNGPFVINIKFSEIVTNFTTSSLTLTNCTLSNHVVISDMEHEYLVTPITVGVFSVEILPNTIRDLAGNYNQGIPSQNGNVYASSDNVLASSTDILASSSN